MATFKLSLGPRQREFLIALVAQIARDTVDNQYRVMSEAILRKLKETK